MKLYLHDEKHDRINASLDLGSLSAEQNKIVQRIIYFLNNDEITTHCELVLAENATASYDEWGEDLGIRFDGLM